MFETWHAPYLWRPLPASIAGGAGTRPDHSITGRPSSEIQISSRGRSALRVSSGASVKQRSLLQIRVLRQSTVNAKMRLVAYVRPWHVVKAHSPDGISQQRSDDSARRSGAARMLTGVEWSGHGTRAIFRRDTTIRKQSIENVVAAICPEVAQS